MRKKTKEKIAIFCIIVTVILIPKISYATNLEMQKNNELDEQFNQELETRVKFSNRDRTKTTRH